MLGESTAARVKGRMLLRPLDFVAVKGKAHAVLVHELIADSPATDEKTAQAVELYSEGLELYRARRFAEAAAKFELVTGALGQADEPSRVMAERSKHYVDAPPPLAWDGSVAMKEK